MEFGACDNLGFARELADTSARAVVVIGMETHVCVFQTARDLVRSGYTTHVVAGAVASRRPENRRIGLSLSKRAGSIITSTEAVVFDWLGGAGSEAFRTISKLIR